MTKVTVLPSTADSLARLHTAEAIGTLVDVMRNGLKDSDRVSAAKEVLDRGHGKAAQAVISIPARQAVAQRLAQLDDSALLAIAAAGRVANGHQEGGVPPNSGDPSPPTSSGSHPRLPFGFTDVSEVQPATLLVGSEPESARDETPAGPEEFRSLGKAATPNPWD